MPPSVELREGSKRYRGKATKGLETFAKFVVDYPQKEPEKVPEKQGTSSIKTGKVLIT